MSCAILRGDMSKAYKRHREISGDAQLFKLWGKPPRRKSAGFTLTEIIAVLVIIISFILLLTPIASYVREKANTIACERNLQKISLGLKVYASEHQGKFPMSISELVEKGYVDDEGVFDCPSNSSVGDSLELDYHYVTGYSIYSPSEEKIVFDKKDNHKGGMHVLYVSGDIVFEKFGAMAE
jgi:competence protein ComGC